MRVAQYPDEEPGDNQADRFGKPVASIAQAGKRGAGYYWLLRIHSGRVPSSNWASGGNVLESMSSPTSQVETREQLLSMPWKRRRPEKRTSSRCRTPRVRAACFVSSSNEPAVETPTSPRTSASSSSSQNSSSTSDRLKTPANALAHIAPVFDALFSVFSLPSSLLNNSPVPYQYCHEELEAICQQSVSMSQ